MKTNAELRSEARAIARGPWRWRILGVCISLYLLLFFVISMMGTSYKTLGVQTWDDFWLSKARAIASGLDYTVPSVRAGLNMTGASSFQAFIIYIFSAIMLFGVTTVALKAVGNDEKRWFSASYGGFGRPFELLWLVVLTNLRTFLWSLLLVIPGIVAVYRYRASWYLKAEHPDWSAWKCLGTSGTLMKGHKLQALWLDSYYFCLIVLVWLGTSSGIGLLLGGFNSGSWLVAIPGAIVAFIFFHLFLGVIVAYCAARAAFYRALPGVVGDGNAGEAEKEEQP